MAPGSAKTSIGSPADCVGIIMPKKHMVVVRRRVSRVVGPLGRTI